jgi:hypothetical protein
MNVVTSTPGFATSSTCRRVPKARHDVELRRKGDDAFCGLISFPSWLPRNAKRHPAHGDTVRTGTLQPSDYLLLLSHNILINISKVDKAIANLESRDQVELYMYNEVADTYSCSRSAVS